MEIAASFLKIQNDIEKVKELNFLVDKMHYDVMDGIFVKNKTIEFNKMKEIDKIITGIKDIHLMVDDVYKYVDIYKELNPDYIIFHYEIDEDKNKIIDYIKDKNIKVGIAINPNTNPILLKPYLDKIDLVLIMSVPPGEGGQQFIDISYKVDYFYEIRKENNLNFLIEVDGGINDKTINKIKNADIAVVGSFITDSDNYENQLKKIEGVL